jgi:hypothetical protein
MRLLAARKIEALARRTSSRQIAREHTSMPVHDKRPLQEIEDGLNDLHPYIVVPRGRPALTG